MVPPRCHLSFFLFGKGKEEKTLCGTSAHRRERADAERNERKKKRTERTKREEKANTEGTSRCSPLSIPVSHALASCRVTEKREKGEEGGVCLKTGLRIVFPPSSPLRHT